MCLGIPGQIVDIQSPGDSTVPRMGTVDFGGIRRSVCLFYTPEASLGDYVVVHVGFAISTVDRDEAARTLEVLRTLPVALTDELGPDGAVR